jgi:hypothetical protein
VARQTGREPEGLVGPALPAELEGVWTAFHEIAGRRQLGSMGAGPLTYPDLAAWAALTGRHVTPFDVRILCRLDDCWLAAQYAETAKETPA